MSVQSRHSARIVSITRSGVGVGVRSPDRGADDPHPFRAEHRVEQAAELRVPVSDEEPDRARPSVEVQREVARLLR
jgi:hypothetical protein